MFCALMLKFLNIYHLHYPMQMLLVLSLLFSKSFFYLINFFLNSIEWSFNAYLFCDSRFTCKLRLAFMDAISPSSSSFPTYQWKYHVFLSFRGEDMRKSFTEHLYAALNQKGIYTFRDDEKLKRGKCISPVIFKAIEDSLFAIVVLFKNDASST